MDSRHKKLSEAVHRQRDTVSQLRIEASVRRTPLSKSLKELVDYCNDHAEEDYLYRGWTRPNDNPYTDKSKCAIL